MAVPPPGMNSNYNPYLNQAQPVADPRMAAMPAQMNFSNIDPHTLAAAMLLVQNANQQGNAQAQPQQITLADGSTYEGSVNAQGLPHGKGNLTYLNHGDRKRYNGEFANGVPSGVGMMLHNDGIVYNGEFTNGKRNGRGVMDWPSGEKHDGMWVDDERHGKGKLINADGTYTGNFNNNMRERGEYVTMTGDRYVGTWRNGKFYEGTVYWLRGTSLKYSKGKPNCCQCQNCNIL